MNWKALCIPLVFLVHISYHDVGISFSVKETEGIDRSLEFITVSLPGTSFEQAERISINESGSGVLIAGQLIEMSDDEGTATFIFPISIEANQEKVYKVIAKEGQVPTRLGATGDHCDLIIENEHFVADMTTHNGIGSGHLTSLQIKHDGGPLLHRTNLDMHWAPSFQKEGMAYKTMSHMTIDSLQVIAGPYLVSIYKTGTVKGYEEIKLRGKYHFFAGLPFFTFSSEMFIEQAVKLSVLRNDEMTMDSLFTHVMFSEDNCTFRSFSLYDREDFQNLKRDPIEDDAAWLAFYHEEKGYAFGCVRLQYNNMDTNGRPSQMMNQHTRITKATKGGRYWNRILIIDQETEVNEGDQYMETNAYFVFKYVPEDPSGEIRALHKQLSHPVEVRMIKN